MAASLVDLKAGRAGKVGLGLLLELFIETRAPKCFASKNRAAERSADDREVDPRFVELLAENLMLDLIERPLDSSDRKPVSSQRPGIIRIGLLGKISESGNRPLMG